MICWILLIKKIKIQNVLLAKESDDEVFIGKPYVDGAEIDAEYVKDIKDKKIIVFKFKSKKKYRNKNGHREGYSIIKLAGANIGGKTIKTESAEKKKQDVKPAAPAEKTSAAKVSKTEEIADK